MNTNKSNEAVRDADHQFLGIQIHVLMSSLIVVAAALYTLHDCALRKFGSTANIELRSVFRTRKPTLFFCLLLYLSFAIPLFWKRFEVDPIEFVKMRKILLKITLYLRQQHFA